MRIRQLHVLLFLLLLALLAIPFRGLIRQVVHAAFGKSVDRRLEQLYAKIEAELKRLPLPPSEK